MVAQVTARKVIASALLVAGLSYPVQARQSPATQSKAATEATKAANRALANQLNFNDRQDFEDAARGLIAKPDTLRGALVRDPLKWASFINETIDLYGASTDVKFQAHHRPMWGNYGTVRNNAVGPETAARKASDNKSFD